MGLKIRQIAILKLGWYMMSFEENVDMVRNDEFRDINKYL